MGCSIYLHLVSIRRGLAVGWNASFNAPISTMEVLVVSDGWSLFVCSALLCSFVWPPCSFNLFGTFQRVSIFINAQLQDSSLWCLEPLTVPESELPFCSNCDAAKLYLNHAADMWIFSQACDCTWLISCDVKITYMTHLLGCQDLEFWWPSGSWHLWNNMHTLLGAGEWSTETGHVLHTAFLCKQLWNAEIMAVPLQYPLRLQVWMVGILFHLLKTLLLWCFSTYQKDGPQEFHSLLTTTKHNTWSNITYKVTETSNSCDLGKVPDLLSLFWAGPKQSATTVRAQLSCMFTCGLWICMLAMFQGHLLLLFIPWSQK